MMLCNSYYCELDSKLLEWEILILNFVYKMAFDFILHILKLL